MESIARQAQPHGDETVVISAINPNSLRSLLEKAGSVLAGKLKTQPPEARPYESEGLSRIA
jgi:hypothetical protein